MLAITAINLVALRSDDRALCRACRLTCRDGARQAPLGDPNLMYMSGAAWYWVGTKWRLLPGRYYAWIFQNFTDKWWVEEGGEGRNQRRLWFMKVNVVHLDSFVF